MSDLGGRLPRWDVLMLLQLWFSRHLRAAQHSLGLSTWLSCHSSSWTPLQCCLAMEGWCLGQGWPKANLGKCHISVSSLLGAIFIYDMGTGNL